MSTNLDQTKTEEKLVENSIEEMAEKASEQSSNKQSQEVEIEQIEVKNLGEILREKRLEQRQEIAQVSSYLKIKISDIEAIEGNDFARVTKHLYLHGLIRSYAKFLKIDQDVLEREIKKVRVRSNTENKEHKLINIGENNELTPDKKMFFNFSIAAFLVFFFLLILFSNFNRKAEIYQTDQIIEQMNNLERDE